MIVGSRQTEPCLHSSPPASHAWPAWVRGNGDSDVPRVGLHKPPRCPIRLPQNFQVSKWQAARFKELTHANCMIEPRNFAEEMTNRGNQPTCGEPTV